MGKYHSCNCFKCYQARKKRKMKHTKHKHVHECRGKSKPAKHRDERRIHLNTGVMGRSKRKGKSHVVVFTLKNDFLSHLHKVKK